ncbi:hypothetical protein [Rhizobium sp. 18055]|uniref:hypothetical protein n=1 Tax=Rhizobium sp. 18055 TaxID=2681403 RepID=UPI0013590FE4|nr:hypothetical protein [Rhizobium sp. 18055]
MKRLEDLRMPVLLVSVNGIIVYASRRAQQVLLDVDVTDMPIECFVVDWTRKRPTRPDPTTSKIEMIFRDGRYLTVCAAVFQMRYDGALVSGIAFSPSSESTF